MMLVVVEPLLFFAAVAFGAILSRSAARGVLDKAALLSGSEALRTPAEVLAAADRAILCYVGAVVLLGFGRAIGARRGQGNIAAPLLLPSLALVLGIGTALQIGYGDPIHRSGLAASPFAFGVLAAAVLGAGVLLVPGDPAALLHRLRWPLGVGLAGLLVALAVAGTGPSGSDTRINLGPIQPLEAAKLGFVLLVAPYLGRRAAKLRYQRQRVGLFRWPRPRLLLPALLILLALQGLMFAVRDLGPVVVLSLVFLVLFFAATRSRGFVVLAVALVAGCLAAVVRFPRIVPSHTVWERIAMWTAPWLNALAGGDQLARALWAYAAGGPFGQGFGTAPVGALPAGHNDLALAHLGEEGGFAGLAIYLVAVGILVLSAAFIGARSRTPERALLATGLGALLGAQTLLIFAGSSGLFPLTGIVAPYISAGRSSMATFVVLAALVLRLAESGAIRAETEELREIRHAVRGIAALVLIIVSGVVAHAFRLTVAVGERTTARGVVTVQKDGTVRHVHDPRVEAILARIRRGEIRDRDGQVLAGTADDGSRVYPLGPALGTLLGPADDTRLRPTWSLERRFDARLRGHRSLDDGPAVWLARGEGREVVLFAVPSRMEQTGDRVRAETIAGGRPVRLLPLPSPDLVEIARIARLRPQPRELAVAELAAAVDGRSIRVTLHAGLQEATAGVLERAAKRGKAAAAVAIDVATGEVLARAQYPDVDLRDGEWRSRLDAADPTFVGAYGPWPDRTGLRGYLQAGSIAKVFTALAAVRTLPSFAPSGCADAGGPRFECAHRDPDGPFFTRPGWERPIHDFRGDPMHGEIGLVDALADSCNVYFGQLGLDLGPEPLADLVADGVQVGWGDELRPGPAGSRQLASTAFGQGAAALSPIQAARLVAAIGAGGIYRACPPSLELGAPCEERRLVDDPSVVVPALSGMRAVMTRGTGKRLSVPDGVRVYGKTGTADAPGLREEVPFGIRAGDEDARPHSWFIALGEPESGTGCAGTAEHRLAVAVAVARGGGGAAAAGPAAMEILEAAHSLGLLGGRTP